MHTTIDINDFRNLMQDSSFSYEGLAILFEYLEEIELGELNPLDIDMQFLECPIEEALSHDDTIHTIEELEKLTTVLHVPSVKLLIGSCTSASIIYGEY